MGDDSSSGGGGVHSKSVAVGSKAAVAALTEALGDPHSGLVATGALVACNRVNGG